MINEIIRKFMASILCLSVICSTNVYAADCTKRVQLLQEGDKAPCKGYLFSPEEEQLAWENKLTVEQQLPKIKKQNEILMDDSLLLEKRLDKWKDYALKLEDRENSFWNKIEPYVYFLSGALITGFIANRVN